MDISENGPSTSKSSLSNADQEQLQFSLSSIIQAHSDDVKCVIESKTGQLISGGRDGFLKIWSNENLNWVNTSTMQQSNSLAINSISLGSAPNAGFESLICLGRKNGSIAIYNASTTKVQEPVKVLQGHKSNVCALYFDDKTGFLMSGSWDHNAVVWPLEHLLKEDGSNVSIGFLSGHKCSVWAVSTIPSRLPKFLTGSADKTIKMWSRDYEVISEFIGHTDVVRSLIVISDLYFFSSSNDATIILWDIQNCTRIRNFLPQHDNFIYTMSLLHTSQADLLISAGEGGCIDIWNLQADATLVYKQALKIPVQSIWSIASMRNGDFAIASSSGMVLVFTTDILRRAPDDIQEFFYSSQYEELALKEKETQAAKDSSFDISRFSSQNDNLGSNSGYFRQIVSDKVGTEDFHDPLTGSGRYIPGTSSSTPISIDKKRPRNNFVPLEDFYKFGREGVSQKVLTCLQDMNLGLFKPLKMTDDEICCALQILNETDFDINECHITALEKALQWPVESAVPALDVFRIALLHPKFNQIFCSLVPVLGNPPKGQATLAYLISLLSKDSSDPIRILSCRALANAASHRFGREMLLSATSAFSCAVPVQLYSTKQALQISSATALANFSSILLKNSEAKSNVTELGPREDILRAIITVLRKIEYKSFSPIALFRILQTIIMLMWGQSTLIYFALEQDFSIVLKQIKDAISDENIKSLIRDAEGMIMAI